MKIKNLSEILDSKEKKVDEPVLQFTYYVGMEDGELSEPSYQPEDFQNIIRLRGNLYFAYHTDPDEGFVYLGEWV